MEYLSTSVLDSLQSILWLILLMATCQTTGLLLLKALGFKEEQHETEGVLLYSIGTGFIALSLTMLLLGTLGWIKPLWIQAGIGIASALIYLRPSFRNQITCFWRVVWKELTRHSLFGMIMVMFWILSCVPAFSPPIGNDSLAYHLAHPQAFLEQGQISVIPYTKESMWPYQVEMWIMLGLILQGTTLAQLLPWVFYPLTCLAIGIAGRKLYGPEVGRYASLVFVSTPQVFMQSAFAYVDTALAFYTLLTAIALLETLKTARRSALVVTAICLGGAIGIKLISLGFLIAVILALIIWTRPRLVEWGYGCLLTLCFGGIWYVRSWIQLGNPVYPFFDGIFGGNGYPTTIHERLGLGKDVIHFITLPWHMTFEPHLFGQGIIGPLYLALLPGLTFMIFKSKKISWILVFLTLLQSIFIFAQHQKVSFYLTLTPLLALGIGNVIVHISRHSGWSRVIIQIVLCILLTTHMAYATYRTHKFIPNILGKESNELFLKRQERSYSGYEFLKIQANKNDKILNLTEIRSFYKAHLNVWGPNVAFHVFGNRMKNTLNKQLMKQEDFDWIWLDKNRQQEWIRYFLADGYKTAYEYDFTEHPTTYSYIILKK